MAIIKKCLDFFNKCAICVARFFNNICNINNKQRVKEYNEKKNNDINKLENNNVPVINLINSGRMQNKMYGNIIRIPMYKIPNQVPIVVPNQTVINNLKVLSELKEGQKLWLADGRLTIDTSHFPTYTRWWYGQKRNIILSQIENDVKDACKTPNREVRELLANAASGIQNMKKIYPDCSEKIDEIVDLITKLQ